MSSGSSSSRRTLRQWLHSFIPHPMTLGWRERLRSCAGALVGIATVGVTMRVLPGVPGLVPLLVAPMGASAVLLFAVPASPLAQPWSIIGGNLVAATVGVACAQWIADPVTAAAVAIACAIGGMFALRCVHPPSGAVALTAVVGGPAIHALGFGFVLEPIALQSAILLSAALVYHALTGHRYPHGSARADAKPQGAAAPARGGFTREDLDAVLKRRSEWLDVDPDDLEALLRETEMQAYARTFGQLTCADLMTKNAVSVAPSTSVTAALTLLDRHRVKALPVVDGDGRLTGIVTRADLTRQLRRPTPLWQRLSARLPEAFGGQPASVATVMTREVASVPQTMPLTALVPLFTHSGHHHIPVVDASRRLVGIITQTDLVTGLHRQTQMLAAA
ncbi:HPP family protein [Burkholderia pseudomultivorans]|uniref:HPP family protein n=1 Tax=Burkholderia pseudomultivorans TaxID=1207504 RepID=UPI000757A770|nr:HPP family protein [Burkholderia pseudomultivorans]KVC25304.1 HPP family protein [Burkholderia pseudomultivorans]KVC27579.1 HPP family protein [Burkholderia pseudomultivorans]KVC50790.1 HPP family protein [Burkholderia pseudomultivorans]KWF04226.1 HPP family protein [Burkholderia pseudomultivorans]MBF5012178.1 HPP family protein [Burkholderia pseudomultivorans]